MSATFQPNSKTFQHGLGQPLPGQLAIDSLTDLQWFGCRESFAPKFTQDHRGLFFAVSPNDGGEQMVADFLQRTEEIINVSWQEDLGKSLLPSRYFHTNRKWAIWVEPSPFWMECEMRRSLLTSLLRCGLGFIGSNYEETLFSSYTAGNQTNYCGQTRLGVMRFLFGFTTFIKPPLALGKDYADAKGWNSCFYSRDEGQVRKLLVEPDFRPSALFGEALFT
jgi:hypothetical protein